MACMFWPWEIIERDHEIQNPTSPEKIRLVGDHLRLTNESRVLDVACGKGGPATILAGAYGCRISAIEIRPSFAEEARKQAAVAGVGSLIDVQTADAATFQIEPEAFDTALCIGATFVWGTIADAAAILHASVPSGGLVAIGEPFWRQWPLPEGIAEEDFVSLDETVARFERAGFQITGIVAASEDDWDHYESLHWRAIEEWLDEHPEHPGAQEVRIAHDRFRSDYFRFKRALLGWAIFVGRKS